MHEKSVRCPSSLKVLLLTIRYNCVYCIYTVVNQNGGDSMDIKLSNASDKPIYEQITEQIKQAIITGKLTPGDPLPSIRNLARELKISVMTTKRAYSDLERDGFIVTFAGKGSFVAERNQEFLREELLRQVEDHLNKAVQIAKISGIHGKELLDLLSLLVEEELE